MPEVTKTLTGDGQFSDTIRTKCRQSASLRGTENYLNISAQGTWSGEINVQRKYAHWGTWESAGKITAPNLAYQLYEFEEDWDYRIGFPTGTYISGTAEVRLGY